MPIMNTLRANHRLRNALIVGVGLLVIAAGGGIAFAQNERQETPYRSSIQVAHDDDDTESTDAEEDKKGMESDDGRDASGDEAEDAAAMPTDWHEAIRAATRSEFLKGALGADMHRTFCAIKAAEYARVARTIADVDYDLYLHTV